MYENIIEERKLGCQRMYYFGSNLVPQSSIKIKDWIGEVKDTMRNST